jgi:hypothetical protein
MQMNARLFLNATKIALPALVLAFALPAFAIDVTFSTTGEFCAAEVAGSCPAGSPTSVTFSAAPAGSITITAIGLPSASYSLGPPVFVNAIEFTSTTTNKSGTAPVGGFFTLTIDQTTPAGGPGIFAGSLSGQIGFHNGNPEVTFSGPLKLDLGGVYYALGSDNYGLPNPGGNGQTFIQMEVTPEPAFMTLTGLGFAGLAFVAYRRRRTVQAGRSSPAGC